MSSSSYSLWYVGNHTYISEKNNNCEVNDKMRAVGKFFYGSCMGR